ncbi:hypothetical protein QUF55_05360 [Clostridiaceae bacterium HSG29]|nr:hypothetical protein [Clostridiaceae bacterium HSG29]
MSHRKTTKKSEKFTALVVGVSVYESKYSDFSYFTEFRDSLEFHSKSSSELREIINNIK